MKKGIVCLWVALWSFCVQAQEIATVEKIEIDSKILGQKRPVLIATPWLYNERDLVAFDVIYVFDAQNREKFDLVNALISFTPELKKFIVVGICSPAYEDLQYFRNSDYLPQPLHVKPVTPDYLTDKPNAAHFFQYVQQEVMPMVAQKYRTTGVNYLVGHSLSASFVVDRAIHDATLFRGFIAASANFSYDQFRLADAFTAFDFKAKSNKFLFLSMGNEPATWRKEWGMGYEKVTQFLGDRKQIGAYQIIRKDYPGYSHWPVYLPAITDGLQTLQRFIEANPYELSQKTKEITLKVKTLHKQDEVFVVGNQESLGNWDPSKIKLRKVSDLEREITLKVRFPMEFKITGGSWNKEGYTNQSTSSGENIVMSEPQQDTISIQVVDWAGE